MAFVVCFSCHQTRGGTNPRKVRIGDLRVKKLKPYLYKFVKKWGLFYTRALPLSRGSSQWVGDTVTGAHSKWNRMSVQPFLLFMNP